MSIDSSYTRSRLACAVVIVMLVMTQSLFAQGSGTLNGRIVDKETGEALVGANVLVATTNLGAAADIDGKYSIHNVPAGRVTLKVSYVGYRPATVDVAIPENGTVEQEIRLEAASVIGETVIVTAQAKGQLSSINQQLASNSIVNVVSAEKMKELPDANIAESIGRLPGIGVQRDAGEADAVIVRGLAPKYEMTIEGVPMSSTYFGDRGVDLSLLGDDLVKGVEVSKTLRPDMDADALGGTVNLTLKTAQPGLHYDVWVNGGYDDLRNSVDNYKFGADAGVPALPARTVAFMSTLYGNYKVAGSVGDRFFDDKLGVLIQGNAEQKQLPSDQLNATYATPTTSSLVKGAYYINTSSAELTDNNTTRHRYGASMILDYASDFVDVKFFNVYDQKKDSNITRDNTTNFGSTEFFDQVFVNQTTTEQHTHSLQALFKFAGTELPISLSYTKGDSYTPDGMELDFYQTGVATTPKGNAVIYGTPLALINSMGVFNPSDKNSYLNNINVTNSNLSDALLDAKLDWKVPFKFSDNISGKISLAGSITVLTVQAAEVPSNITCITAMARARLIRPGAPGPSPGESGRVFARPDPVVDAAAMLTRGATLLITAAGIGTGDDHWGRCSCAASWPPSPRRNPCPRASSS